MTIRTITANVDAHWLPVEAVHILPLPWRHTLGMRILSRLMNSSVTRHARGIRGPKSAWRFLRWFVAVLRMRGRRPPRRAPLPPSALPSVSVLMSTNRPVLLRWALANIACQDYPRLDLALALHGPGFDDDAVDDALAGFPRAANTVRVGADRTLGDALNAAAALATGEILTKMDDDDLYGTDHVRDLVQARYRSGATLIGKSGKTVYLVEANRTVRRSGLGDHAYTHTVLGSTLTISRADFDRLGGWAPVKRGEDSEMIDRVLIGGGTVFRAGGDGYLQVRHLQGHTMQRDESYYDLLAIDEAKSGFAPSLAGIDRDLSGLRGPVPLTPESDG